ncbi:MAG: hypothetical protein NT096_04710 [Proteobacteria bacterium]|nr:hypothetical protein [Pseudomonadota bacterium]
MGKYTFFDDPSVDKLIDTHLNHITSEVIDNLTPLSIILSGSFGRREGSVLRKGSEVNILSDYEIGVVTKKFWKRKMIDQLSPELSFRLKTDVSLFWITPSRLKYNRVKNLSFGPSLPSIFMYELKTGSKLLSGDDCLTLNPIDPASLPLWEGIRLMFNRMAEMLAPLPFFLQEDRKPQELEEIQALRGIDKFVLACADALLLSIKRYHYSCRERFNRFKEECPQRLGEIFVEFPEFPSLVAEAVKAKLDSYLPGERDPCELWYKIRPIGDRVFRYLIKKELEIDFGSYQDFSERYLHHPSLKKGRYNAYHLNFWPIPDTYYENLINTLKLWRAEVPIHPRAISIYNIPWGQVVYSLLPLIFFTLSQEGIISSDTLQTVRQGLSKITYLEPPKDDSLQELCFLTRKSLALWKVLC